jgi:hypothetical protein
MTTWNYRILKNNGPPTLLEAVEWFSIHEVYYDSEGNPTSCTEDPVKLTAAESVEELKKTMALIQEAFEDPVLDRKSFDRPDDSG